MRTITVPVTKAFDYEGRAFKIGDALTVPPVVAASLSRKGVVSLDRLALYHAAEVAPDPDPETEPEPDPEPPPTKPEAAPSVRKRRQRRTYRRRDMRAES